MDNVGALENWEQSFRGRWHSWIFVFTKVARVELSMADNVVDWTVLEQSGIILILWDHNHLHFDHY